jgi:hypothetical protein
VCSVAQGLAFLMGIPACVGEVVLQYREGTLSLDVFDARSHRPVWHGWAKKELSDDDIERSAGRVQGAVTAVLAKFPPA